MTRGGLRGLVAGSGRPFAQALVGAAILAGLLSAWSCKIRSTCDAPPRAANWLEERMRSDPGRRFATILERAGGHRVQISVAEVAGKGNDTCLQRYGYRLDAEYFYPASAIKIVAATAALAELEAQQERYPKISVDSDFIIRPASVPLSAGEVLVIADTSSPRSLRRVIWETLAPSSNSGFNWLFDFAGPDRLNAGTWDAGFPSVRVRHRLADRAFPVTAHQWAPPLAVVSESKEIELQPLRQRSQRIEPRPLSGYRIGSAHVNQENGEQVAAPFDFTHKNASSLRDLQGILIAIARPELSAKPDRPLVAKVEHRELLQQVMAEILPADSTPTVPDRVRYKPMLAGVRRGAEHPSKIRYLNKSGRAYGFMVDNAYVEEVETGRAFFAAATIFANPNDVVGDDQYAYDTISLPFMEALGELLARELLAGP